MLEFVCCLKSRYSQICVGLSVLITNNWECVMSHDIFKINFIWTYSITPYKIKKTFQIIMPIWTPKRFFIFEQKTLFLSSANIAESAKYRLSFLAEKSPVVIIIYLNSTLRNRFWLSNVPFWYIKTVSKIWIV